MLRKILTLLLKPITWPFWYLQKFIPRNNNIWLFGAGEGHRYADNAKWLFEYTIEHQENIEAIWVTKDRTIFEKLHSEDKPVIMANSLKGILKSLRAGVIFLTNKPRDFNAKTINGTVQIWLWHGLMMKQIGNDAQEFKWKHSSLFQKGYKIIYDFLFPEYKYRPDHIINSSAFFSTYFLSAFNLHSDNVHITGYPRNDVLLKKRIDPLIKKINEKYEDPFKILYLPTWRDESYYKGENFNPFEEYKFPFAEYITFLNETNAVFLNKGHDLAKGELLQGNKESRFISINDSDIEDLYLMLKDVDLLITDYSSVYFDFMLTNKPVILAPFDYEEYTTKSRPLYYNYFEEIEGEKAKDWIELLRILKNKEYSSVSDSTLNKFHKYQDDRSSERVLKIANEVVNKR